MKKRMTHSKLFKKYFIYYISILIIPVIIASLCIFTFLYKFKTVQIAKHSETFSQLMRTTFDNSFNNLYTLNESILQNSLLNNWKDDNSFYTAYRECKILSNIKLTIPFAVENIIFIYPNSKYIISSSGTYRADFFYDKIYQSVPSIKTLKIGNKPIITVMYSQGNYYIGYVLKGSLSDENRLNIYTIPHSYFDSILKESTLGGSIIYITDNNNSVIYQYGSIENLDKEILDTNKQMVYFSGKLYIKQQLPSTSTPITYTVLTPLFNELEDIILFSVTYALCISLVLIGGLTLSYHLANKTSSPITNLSFMLKQQIDDITSKEDDFTTIQLAFNKMNDNIKNMKNIIENTNDDIIYINIMKVLTGEISSLEEINKLLVAKNIELQQKFYTVAVFECGVSKARKRRMSGITYKEDYLEHDTIQMFFLNSYDTPYIYALIATKSKNSNMEQYIKNLANSLFNLLFSDITIGYSGSNFYFSEINTHFHQCLLALDHKFAKGKGDFLDFREIQQIDKTDHHVIDYQKFYYLLLNGSNQDIILYISDYYNYISTSKYSDLNSVKIKVFGLFNFLYDTFPNLVSNYQQSGELLLNHYETAEDFLNYICYLSIYLQKNIQQNNSYDKFAEINKFIQDNLQDSSFCVQLIADHFGMSISALSKYYKSISGINISNHVNKLKMDRVIDLLLNTDLSINEIVSMMGYANSSSFIRKFKEYTGITPGKYRETHKNNFTINQKE